MPDPRNHRQPMPVLPALLLFLLGPGCALHAVDEQPQPVVPGPEAWSPLLAPAAPGADPAPAWWEALGDPELAALIEEALAANLSVRQGLARIAQADALLRQVESFARPQLDAVAEGGVAWDEDWRREGEGAGGLALAWELDLWGRWRSAAAAAEADRAAARADLEAVRLLLSAEVADAWYGAVEQRLQLALLDEQRELAATLVELIELRFLQGDASAVDVLQQRSVLAEVETEVPLARARLRAFENRLDVLLGAAPDGRPRTRPTARLPAPGALPPLGVPAELLVRRPDLARLGRLVVAADHRIAEAVAERLPRVTLTGSALLADPITGGAGPATALLGELVQPLVDWGRRGANVGFARAVHEETLLAFSEAYLIAIEEVETTLWQERQQRELLDALARRVDVLERTVEGTRRRYVQGVTDYLPVLTALRELQDAQRELLTRQRELVSLRIQLHRALGDGVPPTGVGAHAPTAGAAGTAVP